MRNRKNPALHRFRRRIADDCLSVKNRTEKAADLKIQMQKPEPSAFINAADNSGMDSHKIVCCYIIVNLFFADYSPVFGETLPVGWVLFPT